MEFQINKNIMNMGSLEVITQKGLIKTRPFLIFIEKPISNRNKFQII